MLVLAAAVLLGSACGASPQRPWLQYAVEDAAAQNKLLIVEFHAEWCKPCKYFEANVLTDPRVQQALDGLIFVRYDIDTPTGRDAYLRCNGRAVPTFVAIDGTGRIRLLKQGAEPTADEFLNFLSQARQVQQMAPASTTVR